MAKDIIIGIDAGTSIIKAVAFTLNGKEIATSSITNIYNTTQNGHATQALDTTWENCIKIILDIKKKIQNLKNRLALISITGQGDGTWLIDKEGNPVCDAWLWLDARSSGVVKELTNLESENSRFNATGTAIFAGQQSAQISFMEKYNPQILNKSTTAFHCKDWIYYKLTKIRATDPSEACFTFGNFRTKNYDKSVINNLGLSKRINLFPDIIDGSKTNHPLINEAANLLDLISGTPVSLAYIDAVCTFLGSGGLDLNKNVGTSILGTTSAHMKASKINDITPNIKLKSGYVMLLPIDNLALQLQTSMSGTLNIDWLKLLLKDIFEEFDINFNNKDFTKKINEWLNRSIPGKIIYHPYISEAGERGPFVNNDAKASIIGLRWNDKFPEIIRSFVEGLCFAARECYNAIGEIPKEIRIVGGGFQSESIRNIFSSVLKVSVRQSNRLEAGATGAAIIGSMSIGLYDDWNSCMDDWINPYLGKVEKHDKELSIIYDKVYKNFLDSRNKIMPLWENINSKIVNNNIN
jgi:erythritol kinase